MKEVLYVKREITQSCPIIKQLKSFTYLHNSQVKLYYRSKVDDLEWKSSEPRLKSYSLYEEKKDRGSYAILETQIFKWKFIYPSVEIEGTFSQGDIQNFITKMISIINRKN